MATTNGTRLLAILDTGTMARFTKTSTIKIEYCLVTHDSFPMTIF